MLAKSAQATGMPVLLTSSMETQAQGLLFAELQQVLPDAYKDRIQREGQVDCMTDQNFSAAVEAMQRKNLIMAGITTDVCIVYPAITSVEAGYQVQIVVDACGSPTKLGDEDRLTAYGKSGRDINHNKSTHRRTWPKLEFCKRFQANFNFIRRHSI